MLPHFVVFSLGHMFLEHYQQKILDLSELAVKKVKENVEFYKVLSPILWRKTTKNVNTTFVIFISFICLETVIRKLEWFVEKEITNSFTDQINTSNIFVVPWAFLILRSLMRMAEESAEMGKRLQSNKLEKFVTDQLQIEAFSKIHDMPVRWNIEKGFGEIKSIVDNGGSSLWSIINACLDRIIPTFASGIFSFIFVSTTYSFSMGVIIVSMSTVFPVSLHFFWNWSKQMRKKEVEASEEAYSHSMDSLSNFQTVKNFACEDNERTRFKKLKEDQTISEYDRMWWSDVFFWCNYNLSTLSLLGITLYAANQLSKGEISYGEYVLLTRLFFDLYYSCFIMYLVFTRSILDQLERLNKTVTLLNQTPEITDKINATDIKINTGRIEFKNVTFSYVMKNGLSVTDITENISAAGVSNKKDSVLNNAETNEGSKTATKNEKKDAICDVSFTVEPGECLALVGPSGSGKSTIAKLLTRMYDVHQGEISIDHQDISEVTMKSLRNSIGVVPQEVELFNDKIVDNIKYGRQHANDEEVHEAASKAEIHEKIMSMDDKYESKVGNKGLKLSGGERQRVGIARIFLKDPKIVILDEATSALDTITEKKIQGALEKASKGKTSVIIAHRLSTICNADQIIVLNEGKVVEKGSHQELLKLGGMYSTMWNQQTEKDVKQENNVIEDE